MLKKILLSKVVFDYTLYPRENVDSYHVRQIVTALEAGATLPPIILEAKTFRIVDGFHRVKAHRRLYGTEAEILAEIKKYDSESDLFADAIRLNADHGRPLTGPDRVRCIAQGQELHMTLEVLSGLLHMTPGKTQDMVTDRSATHKMEPVYLKRTMSHLAGEELSEQQVDCNRKAGGLPQSFYVNQVIALLESGSIDESDERLTVRLRMLHKLLGEKVLIKA